MMRNVGTIILLGASIASAQANSLVPQEASKHIGETNTVCGKVVSAHCPENDSRDKPGPDQDRIRLKESD